MQHEQYSKSSAIGEPAAQYLRIEFARTKMLSAQVELLDRLSAIVAVAENNKK
jgi:hypothetical protein